MAMLNYQRVIQTTCLDFPLPTFEIGPVSWKMIFRQAWWSWPPGGMLQPRFMWLKLEDAHHSLYRTRLDMEGAAGDIWMGHPLDKLDPQSIYQIYQIYQALNMSETKIAIQTNGLSMFIMMFAFKKIHEKTRLVLAIPSQQMFFCAPLMCSGPLGN